MLTYFLVFALFCTVAAELDGTGKCEDEGCLAYPCFENTAYCGESGYLISFGEKYCFRFQSNETINLFDEAGKAFLKCTTPCLIHNMQLFIDKNRRREHIDCDELTSTAMDSHATCYLQCNFCDVCKTNKLAFIRSFDITDFFGRLAIKQVWKVISECGIFKCF